MLLIFGKGARIVATGVSPAKELGIVPSGTCLGMRDATGWRGGTGRQDAALYGRRDASRYGGEDAGCFTFQKTL